MAREVIFTRGYGDKYAEFEDSIELSSTPTTRTVFWAHMSDKGIGGDLIRYKIDKNGDEEKIEQNFSRIKAGDGVKIELNNIAVSRLVEEILKYEEIRKKNGISKGIQRHSVIDDSDYVITDKHKANVIKSIVEKDSAQDFLDLITRESPDFAIMLADSKIQQLRRASLREFEELLSDGLTGEAVWQDFFERNKWIFGLGLRYQILKIEGTQAAYGGTAFNGRGGQRGDFLTSTKAEAKFTCLVEIKTPSTDLLDSRLYRNGAYRISEELAGAIAQLQANCATWEIEGSRTDQNRDCLKNVYTVQPKGLLVVGNMAELSNDREKRNSFERFRRNIQNPEIITFDELKERADFIVKESSIAKDNGG